MKVLNLYAGIGGNRKLWNDVDVTAVELNPEIAKIYKDFFPNDKVIVDDAHQYLLDHYKEFDFIWSSPPCPTHSRFNIVNKPDRYPDMKLYQEIIFLKFMFKGLYVVENVISFYEPLIKPYLIDGHYFWTNIPVKDNKNIRNYKNMSIKELADERLINLEELKMKSKDYKLLIENCVLPKTGLYFISAARNTYPEIQEGLFE